MSSAVPKKQLPKKISMFIYLITYPPIHPEIDTPSLLSPSIVECKKLTDQNNCSKKKEPKPPQICTHLQSFEGATCCLEIKLMFLPQEMITPDPAQPHNRCQRQRSLSGKSRI